MNDGKNKPKDDDWGMTMPHMRWEEKKAEDFEDDFAPKQTPAPSLPPDDWGMTEPNIKVSPPPQKSSPADDWGMTEPNLNLPKSQPSDFDKTAPNFNLPPSQPPASDFDKTVPNLNIPQHTRENTAPNVNPPAKAEAEDWGMTVPNVPLPKAEEEPNEYWSMPKPVFRVSSGETPGNIHDFRDDSDKTNPNLHEPQNFDKTIPNINVPPQAGVDFGNTLPNINLRESESYQPPPEINIPAPPLEREIAPTTAFRYEEEAPAKGGNAKWILLLGGLFGFFVLMIGGLIGAYFLFFNQPERAEVVQPRAAETPVDNQSAAQPVTTAPAVSAENPASLPQEIDFKGEMVLVKAGEFTMGSDAAEDEAKPAHKVDVPAFYIDKYEVTNAQYKEFCDANGKKYPTNPHWNENYFEARPNAPVLGVSFADAKAYAEWAGKRLPTEAEWEKAASWDAAGQTKLEFPWGNSFVSSNAAFGLDAPTDVGKSSSGASPSGAFDMAGNVLEWVDAYFQPYPNSTAKNAEFGEKNRVVRGGHFGSKTAESLKTTKRIYVPPDISSSSDAAAVIGFRCAVSADAPRVKEILQGK